jgi:hypothetical protein
LAGIEEEMRVGEMDDTLEDLRDALCARTLTNKFPHRNMTGQRALTRGQGFLYQITIQILKAKLRYQYSRNALLRLRGHGTRERTWKALDEEDVRGINERAPSAEELAEREWLRALGEIVEGGITHTMSWIWYKTKMDRSNKEMVDGKFVIRLKT